MIGLYSCLIFVILCISSGVAMRVANYIDTCEKERQELIKQMAAITQRVKKLEWRMQTLSGVKR